MTSTCREFPSPSPSSSKLLDIDLTIVSGRHLKNVNWRRGDLAPYAVAWIDPDHNLPTTVDPSGGTNPVWNELLTLSVPLPHLDRSFLTIDVLHASDPSSPLPKPLVGSARLSLNDALSDGRDEPPRLWSLVLRRTSGRPHGKIKVKVAVKERPLHSLPAPSSAPASYFPLPVQTRDFHGYSSYQYVDLSYPRAPNYFSGFYTHPSPFPPPPPTPQAAAAPIYNNAPGYISGPSAPFDSSPASSLLYSADYEKGERPKAGFLAVMEEEKSAERRIR